MIPLIPWYITLIVLATNLTIAVTVWRLVSNAAGRSGLPPTTRRAVRAGSALFLGAWLGAALLAAPAPASLAARDEFYITPLIPLFAALGLTIVSLALWRSAALRSVVAAASLPALIGVQFYRTIGAVFVVLLAQGQLPAHFALPAGWGDVAIGLTAPLVALALARGVPGGRTLAISWSVLGLLDLVVAIGMGTGVHGQRPSRERPAPRGARSAPRSSTPRDGDSSHRTDGARGEHRARIRALSVATYRR